jgi:hypothetical protein
MRMMRLNPSLCYNVVRKEAHALTRDEETMTDRIEYQIQIEGWIDEWWRHWFEDTIVHAEQAQDGTPVTTLRGTFDQAALRGVLCKIWDLSLTVLSVTRVEG